MKTLEEIQKLLQEPLDMDATEQRDGFFGKKLDYMSTFGTKDALNRTFGNACWGYEVKELEQLQDVETKVNDKPYRAYRARVQLNYLFLGPDGAVTAANCEDVGYGDGNDKMALKAHELAGKEAVTDALKRAANGLGYPLGLALYEKGERKHVKGEEDAGEKEEKGTKKASTKKRGRPAGSKNKTQGRKPAKTKLGPKKPSKPKAPTKDDRQSELEDEVLGLEDE